MRKKLYQIIEAGSDETTLGKIYDIFMMIVILVSVFPLAFKAENIVFFWIDRVTVVIFILDYILRFITADYHLHKKYFSFFLYPITPMAIIDLLSVLPSLSVISSGFRILKMFRLFRTLRVFKVLKVFKAFRYSKNITIIINVFKKQKDSLMVVCWLAAAYILISALVIFNVEPDTFNNYFEAIYWATVSLTTVGYGDIYATSTTGQIITMISAIFGIAIVALPAGIITAGYMDEIQGREKNREDSDK